MRSENLKNFKVSYVDARIKKDTLYKMGIFLFSFFYAFFLANLPVDAFVDRDNYLIYAEQAKYLLGLNFSSGLLRLIFNEPIWLLINIFLSTFLNPENVVRFIIFFSSFCVSYFALNYSKRNFLLLLIILFLPQVLKNHIIHLRQGLALSFFLIGWFSEKKYKKNIFFLMSAFIHSSFLFVLAFVFIDKIVSTLKVDIYIKSIICFLAAITLLLLMGIIASMLGARQAEEVVPVFGQISGLGFLFWLVMMILFLLQKEFVVAKQSFIILCIIVYLTTYFFTPYTARIFESTMLLILMAGTYFTKELKIFFIILVGIYFLGQWYPLLDLPKFGWGIENF